MPRKNKEEYNDYMRNYMKKRTREKKGQPILDNDFDPSSASEGKPVLEINKTGDLVKQTQDLLKNKGSDSDVGDDPILKVIDKYGKYVPLVMKFIEGLQGSMKQYNKKDLTPKIQPPEGWLNSTPMQKLGWKYTRSDWYAAGERYDQAIESGYTNPQVNISNVDSNYSDPQPQNLRQLARKYPEAPLVSDSAPSQNLNTSQPKEKNEKSGDSQPVQSVNGDQSSNIKNSEKEKEKEQSNQAKDIVAELQADNVKYIELGADFINGLTDEEFKNYLKNIDDLIEKSKPFIPLLPVQVKGMIIQTTKEDLETLFKEKCPEKFKVVQTQKQKNKLLELFESLQKIISEVK